MDSKYKLWVVTLVGEAIKLTNSLARLGDEACDDEDMMLPAQTSGSWQRFACWRQIKDATKGKRIHWYISMLGGLLIYVLAFWGFVNIVQQLPVVYRRHSSVVALEDNQLQGCDCGNSVAEAISRRCKFDALSMAWLPEHCRDDELTAEFDTTGKGKHFISRRAQKYKLIAQYRS